jgi:hypothetical protein
MCVSDNADALEALAKACQAGEHDFVDGTVFDRASF